MDKLHQNQAKIKELRNYCESYVERFITKTTENFQETVCEVHNNLMARVVRELQKDNTLDFSSLVDDIIEQHRNTNTKAIQINGDK